MSKFKRIIVAGPLVVEAVYPAPRPRDSRTVRQGKKALSFQAQQMMNLKRLSEAGAADRRQLRGAGPLQPPSLMTTITCRRTARKRRRSAHL